MLLRFAGFQLDRSNAELRGPDGKAIKLRPKTFNMLVVFATNPRRVVSKQELLDAVWLDVHVGDDSLFQCIREIRAAIGDEQRQLVKLVSGRGYLFDVDVSSHDDPGNAAPPAVPAVTLQRPIVSKPTLAWRVFDKRTPFIAASLSLVLGIVLVAAIWAPASVRGRGSPTIAVMPINAADANAGAMAANITTRLADGLAKIENVRVTISQTASASTPRADFVLSGELQKNEKSWGVQVRLVRAATGEVVWTGPGMIAADDSELGLQQSRLAASVGHPLALRIGALLDAAAKVSTVALGSPPGSAKVAIEQATASIVQTSRERFTTAQELLEKALAGDPDNIDLAVSLAALQMRGIQMVWYSPEEGAAAQIRAKAILEHALRTRPSSIPALEAYCRFLNATNEFVESLVACARTMNFDPWNGLALYHIGLAQLQLGRFEDALATFKQADSFDTPQVSRWTWQLGVGMTYLLMGRDEDALPWLKGSIAITPASGRSHMLLAAAYERLGRQDEARAAMQMGLAVRPGSTTSNFRLPQKNSSRTFIEAGERIVQACVAAGLPDR